MKKNRFIMKSALFALVLGFGFFNDVNASLSKTQQLHSYVSTKLQTLTDNTPKYKELMKQMRDSAIEVDEHKVNSLVDNLNKTISEELDKLAKQDKNHAQAVNLFNKEAFFFPHLIDFDRQRTLITQEAKTFTQLLLSFLNENKILGKSLSELYNVLKDRSRVMVISDDVAKSNIDLMCDCCDGIHVTQSTVAITFDDLSKTVKNFARLRESYSPLKTHTENLQLAINNLVSFDHNWNSFSKVNDIRQDLATISQIFNKSSKDIQEAFFCFLYLSDVYNQYIDNGTARNQIVINVKDFSSLNNKAKDIFDNKKESKPVSSKPVSSKPAKAKEENLADKFGVLANAIKKPAASVAKEHNSASALTQQNTVTKVSEEKSKVTKTETTDASANTVKETTEENKKTTTKTVEATPAPSSEEAVKALKDQYEKLHHAAKVGDWIAMNDILASLGTSLPEGKAKVPFIDIVYHSSTFEDFLKALLKDSQFKDALYAFTYSDK